MAKIDRFIQAIAEVESGNNPDAISPKGAMGRMQVMPATAKKPGYGIKPAKNFSDRELTRVGRQYAVAMLDRFKNEKDALVAYNWGPENARKWIKEGRPQRKLPKETRNYVKKVTSLSGKTSPLVEALTETEIRKRAKKSKSVKDKRIGDIKMATKLEMAKKGWDRKSRREKIDSIARAKRRIQSLKGTGMKPSPEILWLSKQTTQPRSKQELRDIRPKAIAAMVPAAAPLAKIIRPILKNWNEVPSALKRQIQNAKKPEQVQKLVDRAQKIVQKKKPTTAAEKRAKQQAKSDAGPGSRVDKLMEKEVAGAKPGPKIQPPKTKTPAAKKPTTAAGKKSKLDLKTMTRQKPGKKPDITRLEKIGRAVLGKPTPGGKGRRTGGQPRDKLPTAINIGPKGSRLQRRTQRGPGTKTGIKPRDLRIARNIRESGKAGRALPLAFPLGGAKPKRKPIEVDQPRVKRKPIEVDQPRVKRKPIEVDQPRIKRKPIEVDQPRVKRKPIKVDQPRVKAKAKKKEERVFDDVEGYDRMTGRYSADTPTAKISLKDLLDSKNIVSDYEYEVGHKHGGKVYRRAGGSVRGWGKATRGY